MAKLIVATCQFPVSGDINRNRQKIVKQMRQARMAGADVAHFCETSLGGYAGKDFESFDKFDWDLHRTCLADIMKAAAQLNIWAIVGSNHRLTGNHRPHNSLYIINNRGRLVDRYDKMFCWGVAGKTGDLKNYSPGSHFVTFKIKGVTCGVLICYDFRFPDLYRELYKRKVRVMFHSYYQTSSKPEEIRKFNVWGIIVPATMQAYAANYAMWISANNSSRPASCWPSFFVCPDGTISSRLINNRAGVLVSTIDTGKEFYDAPGPWRDRAVNGIFHSGKLVSDPRSRNRKAL